MSKTDCAFCGAYGSRGTYLTLKDSYSIVTEYVFCCAAHFWEWTKLRLLEMGVTIIA